MTAQTLAEKVTDAVVQRHIFEITPATVVQKLSGLVEMKKEDPTEYVWQFNGGNAASGVHLAQMQFQPGEPGSKEPWQLLQIQLGLAPTDAEQKSVFQSLSSQLAEQLPKLGRVKSSGSGRERAWQLPSNREI